MFDLSPPQAKTANNTSHLDMVHITDPELAATVQSAAAAARATYPDVWFEAMEMPGYLTVVALRRLTIEEDEMDEPPEDSGLTDHIDLPSNEIGEIMMTMAAQISLAN